MDILLALISVISLVLFLFLVSDVLAFLRIPTKLDRVIDLLERIDARLEQEADESENTD